MPKFDVHRTEIVRVKIADVEAPTPVEALEATDKVDLHRVLDREDISLPQPAVGAGARVESVSYHEAMPGHAMVEVAGSHGQQGEYHYDFDARAGQFVNASLDKALRSAPVVDKDAPKAFLATYELIETGQANRQTLLVRTSRQGLLVVARAMTRAHVLALEHVREEVVAMVGPQAELKDLKLSEVPPSAFHALRDRFPVVSQPECPLPLAIDRDEAAPFVPQLEHVLSSAMGALQALADQVGQMRGLFDDKKDPTIQAAVDAGDEAQEEIARLRQVLRGVQPRRDRMRG